VDDRRTGTADRRQAWRGGRRGGDGRDRPIALVVDDHADSRELIAAVLSAAGVATAEASTCRAALDRLGALPAPRVVILDLNLPDCHGTALIRTIRSTPAISAIPVIVLSAAVMSSDKLGADQAGASLFLSKPVLPDALVAAVLRLLDEAAAAR